MAATVASAAVTRDIRNLLIEGGRVEGPRLGAGRMAHKVRTSGAAGARTDARERGSRGYIALPTVAAGIGIPWENAIACPHDDDPACRDDALRRGRPGGAADPHAPALARLVVQAVVRGRGRARHLVPVQHRARSQGAR